MDDTWDGRGRIPGGEDLQGGRGVSRLRRLPGHAHKHGAVGVRRRPLHHGPVRAQRYEVRVVADWRRPSLGQEVRLCGVDDAVVGEAAAAAAVVGHQARGGDAVVR